MLGNINKSSDGNHCPIKSLVNLGKEISTDSDQLREALKRVQDNFRLTGGLTLKSKGGYLITVDTGTGRLSVIGFL